MWRARSLRRRSCSRGCIRRGGQAPAMVHVDVYRLLDHTGADLLGELDSLDLDTDLDDAVVVVEWGEGLAERLSRATSTSGSSAARTRCAHRHLAVEQAVSTVILAIAPRPRPSPPVWCGSTPASRCSPSASPSTPAAHAEQLTPNVVAALADAGLTVDGLDAVVVGCGPGPFTGLQVGMATGPPMPTSWASRCTGVCSLDAIGVDTTGDALVVTDARRGRCTGRATATACGSTAPRSTLGRCSDHRRRRRRFARPRRAVRPTAAVTGRPTAAGLARPSPTGRWRPPRYFDVSAPP